ncbi:FAD-binding oxidoreductase [Brevundimonas subvibrioides]|uniref:D-lactate dehydrogenase (cytochrome) n=1 Tax=Brevundimonas subvibrioides (strain ATCC 15264 / DSM 4735 / LMG 14903 / NBRC 16000 / CB 81) TaxID=633149 RepID=D9QMY8_BRESC|nr:FAD-linked oxidase C-terminal domain-containing protein [Brevundimonas subvibrioides]ADL02144.1 FAD linked oxidase domain protein [Brevundimonas subvibrioides ATCC 15264]
MNALPLSMEPTRLPDGFIESLRGVFGERLHLGEAMRSQHGSSEAHFDTILPDAVVFALSTEDVVAAVKLCGAAGVPIIAYGAGTSIEGNTTPVNGGLTIDLSLMDQIVRVNAEDFDVTVQAGVRREQLNEHLRDVGLFFPIDPGANATIGGMASTRASGTNAVRYGTMREAVLSLRVVTPDGRDIRTARRARKSAAGYDLTRLFVGSEGTLGIITEITLRLHGIPESILSAVCSFETLSGAVDTTVQAIQLGVPLARVEILDDVQMRAVNAWSKLDYPEKTTLFFEFHGSERYVQEQVETVSALASDNGGGAFQWSSLPEERARLWKARHEAYYAAIGLRKGCVGWPTDVCVPISRLAECITETKKDLEAASIPGPILGHVGDGNFHVVFVIDPNRPEEAAEAEALNRRLVQRALDMDGTCTGEHGIGLGKQDWLVAELGDAVDIMRTMKRAMDPQNLFNPGKIFSL